MVSIVIGTATDTNGLLIFVGWWPLIIGLRLTVFSAPFPKYISDADLAVAASVVGE